MLFSTHRIVITTLFLLVPHRVYAQFGAQLPVDHWTRPVAIRLHALGGTAGEYDPAARAHTATELGALLGDTDFADRLRRERTPHHDTWLELSGTLTTTRDVLRTGRFSPDRIWLTPQTRDDVSALGARLYGDATIAARVAFTTELTARSDTQHVDRAAVEARIGRVAVWAGRNTRGYAPGAGGGFVLNGPVSIDGIGLRTLRALDLAALGPATFDVAIGRADSTGLLARPWLMTMRLHTRPHPRFDMGATRAAVFGATAGAHIGARELIDVLVARNPPTRVLDDQVASIDARWRPPLRAMPLELYGEWAMHDVDLEVLWDMPGFTLGMRVPVLPGVESVGLAIEHTQIAHSCCNNPPWYHHFELADGWTEDGRPRGHPLGGHGREWRVSLDGAWRDARVLLRADAFTRERGSQNLYAPSRMGSSRGTALRVDAEISARTGCELRIDYERGRGWSELRSELAAKWRP